MRKWVKRVLWSLLGLVVVAYLGACVWLRVNESRLIFPGSARIGHPPASLALNQQRVEFGEVDGAKLYAWIIPSLPSDPRDNWLLLFHGNGTNVSLGAHGYDDFRAMGFSVMAPEYPGYLDSPGRPTEALIEREGKAAYDYLRTVRGVPAKNIVIFGGSLGAAFAIDLASRVEAGALVEHAGFTSVLAMGRREYPFLPIDLLITNRLESDKKIGRVKMPVLLLHGTEDEVIPFTHAEQLHELANPPKHLVRHRGGHSTGAGSTALRNPEFFSEIATFLNVEAGFHLRPPVPSIAPVIAATIASQGIEPALRQYRSLLAENPRRYKFSEPELNSLGYQFLQEKKVNEAIAVLRLNAEQFPQSFNVFDSLGDAYLAAGNDSEALRNYQRSQALWPDEMNPSRARIDELQRKARSSR
jgi:fermentation-respiration switch protein FrsA (DUF1100 family)